MASKKTKAAIVQAFNQFQNPLDPFGKWDFYGVLFPLLTKKRITYTDAAQLTKNQDTRWGVGIRANVLKDRIRYMRNM